MKGLTEFHSQLAAIMEALTRAAVAEISHLVDESYAVLQLEISRSRQENEALRRKLDQIETIVARGHGGGGFAVLEPGSQEDPSGVTRDSTTLCVPSLKVANSQSGGRRREPGLSSAPAAEASEGDIVIKQEVANYSPGQLLVDECGVVLQPSADDTQGGPCGTSTTPSADLKPWEKSETHRVEPHNSVSVPGSPSLAGVAGDVSDMFDLPSESDEEVLSAAARKVSVLAPRGLTTGELNQADSLPGSRPDTNEVDLSSLWANQSLASMLAISHRQHLEPDHRPITLEKMSDLTTAFPLALGLAAHRLEARDQNHHSRDRRFVCKYCGKCFTSSRSLETHVRVHTGERPYSCSQCGKRFTQSGHLKTHQSVHTGERPFGCQHCTKRFAGKQNLRIHLQKHHPAEPAHPTPLHLQEGWPFASPRLEG
ncbi:zinc finger protein 316-like isoform X1 [Dunckerocampus dactyliophorus]|uniref:zinc finger protein 316-like isoform X1 n=1 Tax=Dunckerocampus dactyliophorus TaxID=161453 RepID=UPI0024049D30|nr:zinc finger protein 316-like isoform X1 [Dunckerocampus dactyliophorus]